MPVRHRELRLNRCALSLLPPRDLAPLDDDAYDAKLAAVQCLRGRIYLADGAIPPTALDDTGRHRSEIDALSWHVLAERVDGSLCGCIRAWVHEGIDDLEDNSPLFALLNRAASGIRDAHRDAIETAIATVPDGRWFEVGGWAVAPDERRSLLPTYLPLTVWALMRLLAVELTFAAATERHGSASLLMHLGSTPMGSSGQPLPSFHDAAYGCIMQILQATDHPAQAYEDLVRRLEEHLSPHVSEQADTSFAPLPAIRSFTGDR
jgi:hypothetical protein